MSVISMIKNILILMYTLSRYILVVHGILESIVFNKNKFAYTHKAKAAAVYPIMLRYIFTIFFI